MSLIGCEDKERMLVKRLGVDVCWYHVDITWTPNDDGCISASHMHLNTWPVYVIERVRWSMWCYPCAMLSLCNDTATNGQRWNCLVASTNVHTILSAEHMVLTDIIILIYSCTAEKLTSEHSGGKSGFGSGTWIYCKFSWGSGTCIYCTFYLCSGIWIYCKFDCASVKLILWKLSPQKELNLNVLDETTINLNNEVSPCVLLLSCYPVMLFIMIMITHGVFSLFTLFNARQYCPCSRHDTNLVRFQLYI